MIRPLYEIEKDVLLHLLISFWFKLIMCIGNKNGLWGLLFIRKFGIGFVIEIVIPSALLYIITKIAKDWT